MKTGLPRHLTMTWCLYSSQRSGVGFVMGLEGKRKTYVLAFRDGGKIDLDFGLGENIGGGGHVD